jgi:predicted nucleotidyltransferase
MSNFNATIKGIKNYLDYNDIKYENLILFGSRARSDSDLSSDYDICLLINDKLDFNQKSKLSADIFRYLFKNNTILPIDLVIKNNEEYIKESKISGYLSHSIFNEGIIQ